MSQAVYMLLDPKCLLERGSIFIRTLGRNECSVRDILENYKHAFFTKARWRTAGRKQGPSPCSMGCTLARDSKLVQYPSHLVCDNSSKIPLGRDSLGLQTTSMKTYVWCSCACLTLLVSSSPSLSHWAWSLSVWLYCLPSRP